MRRLAKRKDIELWSLDECHFQQHGSRLRMWVPPEVKDPILRHAPTRKSVACFGAVSLSTGKFVRTMCNVLNAETFKDFVKKLLRHRSRGKRMVVVLDNARYHHAIMLASMLHKYRAVLTLLFLPPYSPQLAPIERVWKLARRIATHNRYFATLSEVLQAVEACFDSWRKANPVLRKLCGII
ncbi:IS630 family transposase [Undibacterium sp. Di26W]|uniref:IS630 family transposase n=1 Tax=Undibacterium sp. Di26W TaxID=3413035 RepID=UPI003BF3DC5E